MAYSNRIEWTDSLTEGKIMELANQFEPIRMPSRVEMDEYYGNSSLSNRVSKTGGFYSWAERLGLEVKNSETKIGIKAEHDIAKMLSDIGYTVELTSTRYPYDLLVNGCVKIDVKAAHKTKVNSNSDYCYMYRLNKRQQTCDFYIFCEVDDDEISSIYVVPASVITGQIQVGMGAKTTKYDVYRNRFDLIGETVDFFKSLEQHNQLMG